MASETKVFRRLLNCLTRILRKKIVKRMQMRIDAQEVANFNKRCEANGEIGSTSDQVSHRSVSQNLAIRAPIMQQLSRSVGLTTRPLTGDERRLETSNEKSRASPLSSMFYVFRKSVGLEHGAAEDVCNKGTPQYKNDFSGAKFEA